ncbi:hypothetical protein [Novosphingobium sp. AAP83]|uniref:hypothetical protein n=1 Tax=Novosphingobium sp. AAP83 TaxID=1523425 RepID=UPI0018D10F41|nr:hypothetical protein [Novosphingobium sp. AAP83]
MDIQAAFQRHSLKLLQAALERKLLHVLSRWIRKLSPLMVISQGLYRFYSIELIKNFVFKNWRMGA